ncbi:DUF4097 domain-containing protein [Streptomyces sp. NPDC001828]|uniref:DUF4097 family beta strand repeat-containing protein n=1 Tax=Streptomyces sp. NPDC001828 TaxID=3364615 RepID=UPI00368FAA44
MNATEQNTTGQNDTGQNATARHDMGERPRHRTAWIAAALIGALFIVVPCAFWSVSDAISQTASYTGPDNGRAHTVKAVEVDAGVAQITITSGPADHVTTNGTLTWSMKRPKVEQTWDGDTLKVKTRCAGFVDQYLQNCQVDLALAVPAGISLKVHSGSGDIKVRDLTGPVDLRGGSGGIKLYALKGPVKASVGSGELQAAQLASPDVSLDTGSGAVSADFAAPPQHVKARAGSGSVDVTVPQGAHYRVTGSSGSGGRTIQSDLLDNTSDRVIDVSSGSGSVTVGHPGF